MTADLDAAHKLSSYHRNRIELSDYVGCFYCLSIYTASEIVDWVDKQSNHRGQTALCARCGIDSVIGDHDVAITSDFLSQMHARWF